MRRWVRWYRLPCRGNLCVHAARCPASCSRRQAVSSCHAHAFPFLGPTACQLWHEHLPDVQTHHCVACPRLPGATKKADIVK